MKKKAIIISAVALAVILVFVLVFKKDSFDKKVENLMNDMNSYKLQGDMDITKGEDVKKYAIEVGYKKVKKEDYFRVSITDKELNQTQVILRNKNGVYVLTPTLNQIFKFEGDWPLNSLKPYLIQSIYEILNGEDCNVEKQKGQYLASSKVNYPNNVNFKKQEMIFDEDAKIKNLKIKDDSDALQLQIKFNKVDYEAKLKDSYFALPDKLESQVSAPVVDDAQLPLYPMNVYDSVLNSSKTLEVINGVRHVLEYQGDKNFTVIESIKNKSDELETVIMPGEFVDSIDAFGFFDGNHMQMIKDGVEYTIYSDELTPEEMAEVLNSMQVVVMK